VADQAAKEVLNEEIDHQQLFPPQDLMKMDEKRGAHEQTKEMEGGENVMKHGKASVSWQNDTAELNRKEQVVISRLKMGYTRATHRYIHTQIHTYTKNRHTRLPILQCTSNNGFHSVAVQRNT
jgi:hypothetical protein